MQAAGAKASARGPRILIVEDNRADVFLIREAIRAYLVPEDVCIVEHGSDAMTVVEEAENDPAAFCPELVLLDLNLPRQNGFEILRRIRRSPLCGTIPVVVVTSSDSARDKAEAGRLGANRYFRKPASYDEYLRLGAVLTEVLAESGGNATPGPV